MVRIPGGRLRMGTSDGFPYEGPVHEVEVAPLLMDRYEVTNAEFERFVQATHCRTDSERYGWTAVFDQQAGEWRKADGADWRHPEGPDSDISGRMKDPVVQVSWNDAAAYARWAGKRLPTEAEWEWAARGGLRDMTYPWGNELRPGGKFQANYWQGPWPAGNTAEDGFKALAPVGSFLPNGYGLYDMVGNAWEWVADWYADDAYHESATRDPRGPKEGTERVIRGGSFLCNDSYCVGYRVAARNKNTPESATNNTGFRCAR
jgi:formylglycine-generating enzyme required for sulfatase activity